MDFFDKLKAAAGAAADTVNDIGGDLLGVAKLTAKVVSENAAIHDAKKRLGDMVYREYESGTAFSTPVMDLCAAICRSHETVAALQAEIAAIKTAAKTNPAAAEYEPEPKEAPKEEPPRFCPACGAKGLPDSHFCVNCGAPLS